MSRWYRRTVRWSPVIVIGALWVYIAGGNAVVDYLRNTSIDDFEQWAIKEWVTFFFTVTVAPALVLKAFLETTYSDHKKKISNEDVQNPPTDAPHGNPNP